ARRTRRQPPSPVRPPPGTTAPGRAGNSHTCRPTSRDKPERYRSPPRARRSRGQEPAAAARRSHRRSSPAPHYTPPPPAPTPPPPPPPHTPPGPHRLQTPPIFKHQRLTRRTQHSRAHERPTYPRQQRGANSGNNQRTHGRTKIYKTRPRSASDIGGAGRW